LELSAWVFSETSMRAGEFLGIQMCDVEDAAGDMVPGIDVEGCRIYVKHAVVPNLKKDGVTIRPRHLTTTKYDQEGWKYVEPETMDLIVAQMERRRADNANLPADYGNHDLLIVSKSTNDCWCQTALSNNYLKTGRRAGVKGNLGPHRMRRTALSAIAADQDGGLEMARQAASHSDVTVTKQYIDNADKVFDPRSGEVTPASIVRKKIREARDRQVTARREKFSAV
jgi:integrase